MGINPAIFKTTTFAISTAYAGVAGGLYALTVGFVGRIETYKGVRTLIEAMAHIPPQTPLRLVIAGDGTQRANTERLVDSLGLGDRVTFLGAVDDRTLLDLYAGALGVVYAPFDEDFGYVTLEAFLARKPVITATDAGGPGTRAGR